MTLALILLGCSMILEMLAYALFRVRLVRWALVTVALCLVVFASTVLLAWWPNSLSILIFVASLYRLFNGMRMLRERMHPAYLRAVAFRTGTRLMGAQLIAGGLWWVWAHFALQRERVWLLAACVQLAGAAVLLLSFRRRLAKTRPPQKLKKYMEAQLPSLTVAIPARNETDDLQACLETLVASDYPKLEILVLDDCSQNKRTPEIIRGFAHDGVRFVAGDEPRPTWLAKNQAYDRLLQEATGEYVLFCGVDVRFRPSSLRTLVTIMMRKKKAMVSVLPLRSDDKQRRTSLVQAMRYWWELVPPRRLFERPAVLSTCWIAQRSALLRVGGFAAVTRMVVPEAYFAKAMTIGDRYSFVRSDSSVGIASTKAAAEQWQTAVRMRYPQLHRQPEQVFLTSLAEVFFLGLPFGIAAGGWWYPISVWTHLVAAFAAAMLTWCFVWMSKTTRLARMPLAVIGLPLALLLDLAVAHRSMWQYEFSDVQWKGRNVCIPVMHTYAKLPDN